EVDLSRELLQQRPHHQQVITPDELVPPARLKRVTLLTFVDVKECSLETAFLRLAPDATLVDGLDDLEGQGDARYLLHRAVIVVFSGPPQLGFSDFDLRHFSYPLSSWALQPSSSEPSRLVVRHVCNVGGNQSPSRTRPRTHVRQQRCCSKRQISQNAWQ